MRIVNLMENTEGVSCCGYEHGLCFYIETEHHKLLMDTGQSDLFINNAEKLGIDLKDVDTVVISHGHYDHGGGVLPFAGINTAAKIYIQESAFEGYYSLNHGPEPRYIGLDPEIKKLPQLVLLGSPEKEENEAAGEETSENGIFKIDEELSVFSGIESRRPIPSANDRLKKDTREGLINDDFSHEQCLVVRERNKTVLLSGCAHHGILNILDRYRELYGSYPDAVFSGFHMMKKNGYSGEDLNMIVDTALELKKIPAVFYTGHCTGLEPYEAMKKLMGDSLFYVHCGDEIHIDDAGDDSAEKTKKKRRTYMKEHKFWAWATVTCFFLTMWTGYKRK